MSELSQADQFQLSAASGWLDLGNTAEACAELDRISPKGRLDSQVLSLEWEIHSQLKDWENALAIGRKLAEFAPDQATGFVKQAFALHEMKRTQEAWDCLLPASKKFIDEQIIPYNLACYACQLGQETEALRWLRRALRLGDKQQFRKMALADPDLEPIRDKIGKL